ncbi:hypothetical protein CJF30_00010229 [Rutstroemia sp. NJR-2017a BBW]|nr:hypothetical protein CJF30_00010229 [Rutstroemia sp. NJR-2017a BBW]
MGDPASMIGGVAGTISSSISIISFINNIKNTPTDVKTCFALTHRVSTDLEHLILLRNQHHKYLREDPTSASRIDGIISSAKSGILDICQVLEGCRKEIYEDGSIPLRRKMSWVLGDSAAFTRRSLNLQQQHAAINTEIMFLRQLSVLKPLERTMTTTFENVHLLSMRERRRRERGGSAAGSGGSGALSPTAESFVSIDTNSGVENRKDNERIVEVVPPLPQLQEGDGPRVQEFSSSRAKSPSYAQMMKSNAIKRKALRNLSERPVEEQEDRGAVEERERVDDGENDDDLEAEYYRDLRRQEEERRRRLAAKKALRK